MHPRKIYLAGPDVFFPEVFEIANQKKNIILKLSNGAYAGVHPFDKEAQDTTNPLEKGRLISRANRELMDQCDIILANITPFRGANIDDGTAFEIGYMTAQGKPVYTYSNAGHDKYVDNVKCWSRAQGASDDFATDDDGYMRDINGATIEQFGFPCNLMIGEPSEGQFFVTDGECPATDLSAFEQAVRAIVDKI